MNVNQSGWIEIRKAAKNPVRVPFAMFGRSYPSAIRIRKKPMMRSHTIPIQAAFQDKLTATVSVAMGPIMNPEIQSRSIVTKHLTPVSSPQPVGLRTIQHRGFQSHASDHLQISDIRSERHILDTM